MRSTLYPTVVAMLFISMVQPVHSQTNSVAIGSTTPDKDAVLLLVANGNQGLIIPKVNLSGAPSGFGKSGMIVYNTQDNKVYYYDGGTSTWKTVGSVGTSSGPILSATQVLTGDGTVNSGTVLSGDASINAGVVTIKGIEGKVLPSLPGTLQYLAYDGTTGTWKFQTPGGSGTVTQVISGTGLTGGPITTSGTLNVDVGTTANKIVQLDANAKLPAVNGSQVTTLNATNITTGTLGLANGGTGITTSAPGNNKILSTDGTGAVNWAAVSGDVSLSSGALTVSKLNGKTLPAFASGALTSDASGNLTWVPASGTGTVTQVSAGTGLTGGPITTSGTLTVDVGTTANKIVQLDASGKLPAVDGSQLTNLPSSPVADGSITGGSAGAGVKLAAATITDANISATAGIADTKLATISTGGKVSGSAITTGTIGGNTIINTTGNVTAGNISGNGSGLTTLNATNISSGTLSLSRLTSGTNGQVLTVSGGVPIWQAPAASGTVTQVSSGTGLTGGPITTTGTLAVNVGTAANQIVQLDASAKLPAVDGSQLTALNATNISAGTLSLSRLTTGTNGNVLTMSAGVPVWQTPAASGTVTQVSSGTGLTGGPITTTGTLAVNVGTAANQIVQLDASAKLPAVNGSQLTALSATNITTGTLALANGGTGINNSTPGNNKLLSTDATGVVNWTAISGDVSLLSGVVTVSKLNGKVLPAFTSGALTSDASGNLTWVPASGTGTVTQVSAGTGLTGGPITTSGTLNVDVGTTANKIVQLDASAKLPAVDGSQLTGLNAANITTGTLPVANGGTGVTTAANGQLLIGNGTGFTAGTLTNGTGITVTNAAGSVTVATSGNFGSQALTTTGTITGGGGLRAGGSNQFTINGTGNITKINNVVTSFPAAQGGTGTLLTNDGSGNLSWAASSGWGLTGSTGTSAGTNFIGTTDAQDLVFKTNGSEKIRILNSNGYVGVGTASPSAGLEIGGAGIWDSALGLINSGGGTEWRIASDVDGSLKFVKASGATITPLSLSSNGAVAFNNIFGAVGQVLTSQGSTSAPTWSTIPSQFSTSGSVPRGNGTGMVASSIFDDGTNVSVGGPVNTSYKFLVFGSNESIGVDNTGITIGDVLGNSYGNYFYTDFENTPRFAFMGANVGVGTINPSHTLDVSGEVNASDYIASGYYNFTGNSAAAPAYKQFLFGVGGSYMGVTDHFIPNNDDVQDLGTTSFRWRNAYLHNVDVTQANSGTSSINATHTYSGNLDQKAVQGTSINNPGYGYGGYFTGGFMGVYGFANATTYSSSSYGLYGTASGSSGTKYGVYGTTSSTGGTAYGVYCNGNGGYSGSWSLVSDRKLKKDIQPLENTLDRIMKLKPSAYYYRTDEYKHMNLNEGRQAGLIAQEVEEVFPEVVTNNVHPGDEKNPGKENQPTEYKGIDYIKLVPVLIKAIQEQQQQIEALKLEVEQLKKK